MKIDLDSLLGQFESNGFESVDYYRDARDSYLSHRLASYPNLSEITLDISFQINRAKNAPVVYAILDSLPKQFVSINVNSVKVSILDEASIMMCFKDVVNLLAVVRNWKSLRIESCDQELDWLGMRYMLSFLCDRNDKREPEFSYITVEGLKKKYLSGSKPPRKAKKGPEDSFPPLVLSGSRESIPMQVANRYKEVYLRGFEVEVFADHPYEVVLLIEDSLVVDFCLVYQVPHGTWEHGYHVEEYSGGADDYLRCQIQELTDNSLFKFNFSAFRRGFVFEGAPGLDFLKFHGINYYRKDLDRSKKVDSRYPELNLLDRQYAYPGETYHFVVLEMMTPDDRTVRGIGYTKGKVHAFILKICKDLEERNSRSLELNGLRDNGVPFRENRAFVDAFLSWKGKKKRWRLENKFSYYYIDMPIKTEASLYSIPSQILANANQGLHEHIERGTYSKPINRWKSEELVYTTTKKLYGDYQVIYQFSPHFLSTGIGTMSYDVYICGLKVAIEYQGIQHFKPVDYFGGEENHLKQVERDKLKKKLSEENGVHLVYVNYWEDITPALIRSKIEEVLSEKG